MVDDQPPRRDDARDRQSGADKGWTAVSYLVSGIVVWGFGGWLVDRWLETGGIAIAIGAVVGAAGGVYLIARRLST
jgi:ATP synthase protein I